MPIILGSDKTTVSVATGQNDYYPLYASIGNVHNNVCRAHHNVVAIIAFLAIPRCEFSIDSESKMFSDIRIEFAADKHYQNKCSVLKSQAAVISYKLINNLEVASSSNV